MESSTFTGSLLLALASLASTLHLCFRLAGDAGVPRFIEKYPSSKRYAFWMRHWAVITASLLVFAIGLAVTALFLLAPDAKSLFSLDYGVRWLLVASASLILLRVIPSAIAEGYADRITSVALPVAAVCTTIVFPFAWIVAQLEKHVTHLLVSQAPDDHRPSSEDEIISLMEHADSDDLEESEREMIRSVLEFGETITREIMTHRVDVVAFEHDATIDACVNRSKASPYSRFPVYADSLDDIRGVVHVKDLLRAISEGKKDDPIVGLCNKVAFVPESMPIDDLFRQLRATRAQLAVVVDEYGGTAGLVSMEDIIEELVGEIHDEYDPAEMGMHAMPDGSYMVNARESVHDVNEALHITIPEHEDYDSIGGYVFHELGKIPAPGECVIKDTYEIRVHTASPNRIHVVRVMVRQKQEHPAADAK
jgi:putative hemolysin